MILDPEKFRNFEHAGWESIPDEYHQAFGNLTSQAIGPLLAAAGLKSGMTFLDVASGPGYVAAAAAKRGATVLGVDFSAAMVAYAQQLHPSVEFREGPPFFRYSDPEECTHGLIVAGFEAPTVTKVSQTWSLPAGDGLFNAMKGSTVRTAGLLRAQKPTVLDKIRDAMREELEEYTKGDVVKLPMPALIADFV